MRLPIRMPVAVDRRLDVLVAELLLDEVDRLSRRKPERRGRVSEVVQADLQRQARINQSRPVPEAMDPLAADRLTIAGEDQLSFLSDRRTSTLKQIEEVVGYDDGPCPVALRCAHPADLRALHPAADDLSDGLVDLWPGCRLNRIECRATKSVNPIPRAGDTFTR